MSYTESELKILEDNKSPSNFLVSSLTFINTYANIIIEDAVKIDSSGNLVIKDSHTELVISEAVSLLNNVIETKESLGDITETIYFIDKENSKISLGKIFENLFINKSFSGNRWFTQTRSLKLDYSLEGTLKENFYSEYIEERIDASGNVLNVKDVIENTLSQSNVWHSVPIEVITEDYVSDKYSIISTNIPLKYKSTEGSNTIFRIFDATAGIELARTSVYLPPVSIETIINIPLNYQGHMPDSPIAKDTTNCDCIIINDLDNLELVNGKDKGTIIAKDQDGHYLVPISRHVIKIQWQTCDIIEDYLRDPSFGRSISSNVFTSLSVDVYNNKQVDEEYIMINGNFFIGDIESTDNTYTIDIDTTKYNFSSDYVIGLSTTKNVKVYIIDRQSDSFTLKWNKDHSDCQVNWKITKVIKGVDEDLVELGNVDRELNYTLFKNKTNNVILRNVCGDIETCITDYATYEFKELLPSGGQTEPYPDEELINGLREYTLFGYEDINEDGIADIDEKTIRFYKATDFPEYTSYFSQSGDFGTWRFTGIMKPGNNVSFFYSPNAGYCGQEPVTYKLPISTVRIPKVKCNLCDDVDITYTLMISGGDKPTECGTSFYHVTDSFGTVGYSNSDDFSFKVALDTEDTTCTFEISGSDIVGTNELVTILKKINYDEVAYGETYSISGAPSTETGMFDPIDTIEFSDDTIAFLTTDNNLSLNVDYDYDRYTRYFSPSNDRKLKTTGEVSLNGNQFNRFLITDESFLGQELFGYQVVLFDPFLLVSPVEGVLPLFPDYDPIGNQTTLEGIIEYINRGDVYYTNENFIPFPNFTIGNFTIDGSKYNPLLDYRNYRIEGTYNTYFGKTTFKPTELDIFKLSQNSVFEMTSGSRHKVVNDGSNTGLVDKGNIVGIDVEVYRSGRKFVPINELFWNTFISMNESLVSF